MDVACEVLSDRLGSDHYPIIITANTSDHPVPERVPKWNFRKAKWDAFQDQCITEIIPDLFNDAEDKMAVKRISIRYSLCVLTIKGQTVPKRINIGYLKKETRPYIPNPQRCFQCQKFGHTKNSCKGKAVCAGCGEEGHNLDDCKNEPKCVNCQGDHVAISRDCPKWKIEKDIVTLKYTEKISFADARKRLQPSFDPSKDSYATVTQTPPQSSKTSSTMGQKNPTSN